MRFAPLMAVYSQLFASLSLIGLKFSLSASAEFALLGLPKIISFGASCVTETGLRIVATSTPVILDCSFFFRRLFSNIDIVFQISQLSSMFAESVNNGEII